MPQEKNNKKKTCVQLTNAILALYEGTVTL